MFFEYFKVALSVYLDSKKPRSWHGQDSAWPLSLLCNFDSKKGSITCVGRSFYFPSRAQHNRSGIMWQKKRCFRVVEKCRVVSRWLSRCAFALKGLIKLYFLTRSYDIFNWGEGYSAIWDYFYVQIRGLLKKKKIFWGFLLEMSTLLLRDFWHSTVRKCTENFTVCHCSQLFPTCGCTSIIPDSWCLISEFLCKQFTVHV